MKKSFILLWALFVLIGCQTPENKSEVLPEQSEPAEKEPLEVLAVQPDLLPEDLQGRVGFRRYSYSPQRPVTISVVAENMTETENITLEMAAEFMDEQGEVIQQTAWDRFTLNPRQRHQFFARTTFREAGDARILVRTVENNSQ